MAREKLDALNDSIAGGQISAVEIPYRLVVRHYSQVGKGAKKMTDDLIDLIREIVARGCPVVIVVEE